MKKDEVKAGVYDAIEEVMCLDRSEINEESHITNDLGADSLDAVELIMKCETTFGVSIPDEEAEKVETVSDLIDKLTDLVNKK